MNRLVVSAVVFLLAFITLFSLGTFVVADAPGLEIQVAPQTLVVSSGGDNVTIHTDYPGIPDAEVVLEIGPASGTASTVEITDEWTDDCGFYVVRCTRDAAAAAVGKFEGKRTTAVVTLCIDGDCGNEEIAVRE